MISIENLRFQYPRSDFRLAIDDLSVETGAKVAIVGPSGSGKTTLLNLIGGIAIPESGRVTIDEKTISDLPDSARRNYRISNIGMVFQQFELVEYLNLHDNILFPFLVNNSLDSGNSYSSSVNELATGMGLSNKMKRFPGQLSQGEQQRVAICRAVITNPKIILADEPTGNLDPRNKTKILDLLFEQCSDGVKTLVVVTHDMNILSGFDRVIDFDQFRVDGSGKDGMA